MTADLCPHCFAPARDNGRPGCACAARAAAAAAAAAGDSEDHTRDDRDGFDDEIRDDPMGPRPYVTFSGEDRRKGPELRDIRLFERMTTRRSAREDRDAHDADTEVEQAARADGADNADRAAGRENREGRENRTAAVAGAAAATQAFEPLTQPIDRIGSIEAARAEADGPTPAGDGAAAGTGRHRKSRRGPVVAVLSGAAAVAVAGTLAFGTGLLGGDKKHDQDADRALSDPSSSAPDDGPSTEDDETPDKPSPSASSATPTATPSTSGKESTSPRPSRSPSTLKSNEASKTATPPAPSTTDATGSVSPGPTETPTPTGPPVLEEGDSGSEVVELQKRLAQLLLYLGATDGEYDDAVRNAVSSFQNTYDVEGDPKGVYGPHTRRALESRTDEP
ncbi:peptidoglycan-binding domain-containing protein [Streptomyces sp. ME19-01-6]|uniref:peptidoglycan-binding domain-containing protein n=1 Tax=Streptomyces sp. ME19-01-6 TaxID=3028686 RepID=UPI0029BF9128|nr:peptidoglycan-binding protein [Streptomyces sp. ME19-01-6]MDX3224776.1 peptidoglycan-binding protein [Streptomyces sp. ME19-01-6]